MRIDRLIVNNLRNLESARLEGLSTVNLIYGDNGAGKTSLLESVHLVCEGRSFRHGSIQPLVAKGSSECTVFAELSGFDGDRRHTVGVSKRPGGGSEIRLDRELDVSALDLAQLGSMQVLAQEYGDLFEGGPDIRRRFMDWGLFHVEHRFMGVWRRFQSALRQRNSLLRRGRISPAELQAWDREYIAASLELHELRENHVSALIEEVPQTLGLVLNESVQVKLAYVPGWETGGSLEEALSKRVQKDLERGFTSCGPQRADLKIATDLGSVANTLSRGQRKLVGWGLRIGHGEFVAKRSGKPCVYLVDDLHSELDPSNAIKVAALLVETGSQCFVTSAVPVELDPCLDTYRSPKVFHVEHGRVQTQ